ncbi:hypothetical protein DAI22_03g324000 [Oryza sativa Japonica Group]|nr:hypothetical protein DAI22_03g324000 [Oryza sativa Japonica Group]KAF2941107.1 hypothetical protein DAI22_03g324000 [Oryza sativa Japonica Group]KAF2941108.1 hypothetical protein DAI22_03g324000 [Oryza sativa Japonica Group]
MHSFLICLFLGYNGSIDCHILVELIDIYNFCWPYTYRVLGYLYNFCWPYTYRVLGYGSGMANTWLQLHWLFFIGKCISDFSRS